MRDINKSVQAARRLIVMMIHVAVWAVAYIGAFLLRFDGAVPEHWRHAGGIGLAVLLVLRVTSFWLYGLFHGIFRYAGIPEIKSIIRSSTIATGLFVAAGAVMHPLLQPRSIYVGDWVFSILGASGIRLAVRMLREGSPGASTRRRTLLIGAGDAGEMFMRDIERVGHSQLKVVGILDDDPEKHGRRVRGIRVEGPVTEDTLSRAKRLLDVQLAVLAIPSASGDRTREIVSACHRLRIETKTLPSLEQILNGHLRVSMLRDVAIEDLLRREPVELDATSMDAFLRGKRVMVTGAAGSIGSELVRQAARYEPAALALLDHNENGIFFLGRSISEAFPLLALTQCVADIKDVRRMSELMQKFRPHVVLHAAAHKHVPLMEANPGEAVKNNIFGTRIVADLANAHGVETFVLISTDKAVKPSSVMGACKRIAEMYLQAISGTARTRFVAVRFGNVLGSAGSVVPIFREQIAQGGPITVTHPEMSRYFMTIPEASQLVLQAGALAKGGELFLLDMGEPIKIVDLAKDMIRMSGLQPDTDIKIVFSGERPGEKLHEELLHAGEDCQRTVHPKILVGRIKVVDLAMMHSSMVNLASVLDSSSAELVKELARIVPEAKLGGANALTAPPEIEQAIEQLSFIESLQTATAADTGLRR